MVSVGPMFTVISQFIRMVPLLPFYAIVPGLVSRMIQDMRNTGVR